MDVKNDLISNYITTTSLFCRYVQHPKGKVVDDEFLKSGKYEIEVSNRRYPSTLFLKSPFDPTHNRILGDYEFEVQEQVHFED